MSLRAVVVADDLTGACDAGVAFAPAYVVLREPWPLSATALVFSTASRNDPPAIAAAKVRDLVSRLPPGRILFKKIDSVLRGNIREELEAMNPRDAIVCPAFPEQNRFVRAGIAQPSGVDLRALLAGLCVSIPDAETPADLARVAAQSASLYVGSAGLARALGRTPPVVTAIPSTGTPLLIIGSSHPVTLTQLEDLRASKLPCDVHCIDLTTPNPAIPAPTGSSLFLCGGDAAAYVLHRWEATALSLQGEIEPGIPVSRIVGGQADGVALVTKSGGFGSPDTLGNIVQVLSS